MFRLNGKPVDKFKFPGGEVQVRIPLLSFPQQSRNEIYAELHSSDDIMALMNIVDAIRRIRPSASIHLDMPYVPYARQDRSANAGESCAIKVFCNMINSLKLDSVTISDPHSDVATALLDNVIVNDTQDYLVYNILGDNPSKKFCLVSPDAGAAKKTRKVASTYGLPVVYAMKTRDTMTGELGGVKFDSDEFPEVDAYIVLDDIADGGGSFINIAKAFREHGVNTPLILAVSHGIFSKGTDIIYEYYTQIYCAYPWVADPKIVKVYSK